MRNGLFLLQAPNLKVLDNASAVSEQAKEEFDEAALASVLD